MVGHRAYFASSSAIITYGCGLGCGKSVGVNDYMMRKVVRTCGNYSSTGSGWPSL